MVSELADALRALSFYITEVTPAASDSFCALEAKRMCDSRTRSAAVARTEKLCTVDSATHRGNPINVLGSTPRQSVGYFDDSA